ncbi:MAG: hypothetical protein K2O38_00135, partial [Muribaculaceae bacterium]|nr:hypothetical protein [Muribaculaceae bacterium]
EVRSVFVIFVESTISPVIIATFFMIAKLRINSNIRNYIRLLYLKSINFGCALCFLRYSQTSEERLNLAKNIAEVGQENAIYPSHRLGALSLAKKTMGIKRDKTAMAKKNIHLLNH